MLYYKYPQRQWAKNKSHLVVDCVFTHNLRLYRPFFNLLRYLTKKIMPLLKSKKEEIIKDLGKEISGASSVVFVNFHGLKVADETKLRSDLRNQGVSYRVSRKTLIKRAIDKKTQGEMPELTGEVALVYGSDQIAPAREIFNFQKATKAPIQILGGIFDGKFVDGVYMTEIATIPTREVLLSKIAFLLQSPMQRLAIAVNEVSKTKN